MTTRSQTTTGGEIRSDRVRITIDLDPADWWLICSRAESTGGSVADVVRDGVLVAGGARVLTAQESRLLGRIEAWKARRAAAIEEHNGVRASVAERVVELVLAGCDDGAVSRALDISRLSAATYRRKAGLKPNKPGRLARESKESA